MRKIRISFKVAAFCFAAVMTQTKAQTTDVYVGGQSLYSNSATVWKNGTPTYLTTGEGCVNSVVVGNGQVYSAGVEVVSGKTVAKVWQDNNVLHTLTNGTENAIAYSIALSGSIVYTAGYEYVSGISQGRLWTNGTAQAPSDYANAEVLYSVFVYGSDIYAAGMTKTTNQAAVWKNGTLLHTLTTGIGKAYSVVVDGDSVYTTGWEYDVTYNYVPKVWKNSRMLYQLGAGVPSIPYLSYTTVKPTHIVTMQLCISNGDIYVAGFDTVGGMNTAKLWINGTDMNIPKYNGSTDTSWANSVSVLDGDVYVAGTERDSLALLWTNGNTPTMLSSGCMSQANSIFTVNTSAPTTYPVTVTNGSGSGNYAENATVTITADPAPAGKVFKEWVISPSNVTFTGGTSVNSSTATFTMPAQAVTATATYDSILSTICPHDVYVGGQFKSFRAAVWKNGVPTYLTAGDGCVRSVVVDNGQVYAAGTERASWNNIAKVWKDGNVLYTLTDGTTSAFANSIVVSGNNIYVAGQENQGKLWKNGIAQSGYTEARKLNSVFVYGNDVYAAGYTTTDEAAVWKNGTLLHTLTSGIGNAYSVVVDGDSVYTTGVDNSITKVWKNGRVLYTLGLGISSMQLYISNGNIYVAGSDTVGNKTVAKLWINGIGINLPHIFSTTTSRHATSVFVLDGDIYAAGIEDTGARLWTINGGIPTTTILDSGFWGSSAWSVFVTYSTDCNVTVINGSGSGSYAENSIVTITADPAPAGKVFKEWVISPSNVTFTDGTSVTSPTAKFIKPAQAVTATATYDSHVGIAETRLASLIQVYPNPTNNQLRITGYETGMGDIVMYDVVGRVVETHCNTSLPIIDISHLESGLYFLKVGGKTIKIIKN